MENRKHQVDEIMESLDGMHRAGAPNFFYTRLKARMLAGEDPVTEKRNSWQLRPVYAFGAFALLLLLNAFVLLQKNDGDTAADTDNIQSIVAEYNLPEANSVYDLALEK